MWLFQPLKCFKYPIKYFYLIFLEYINKMILTAAVPWTSFTYIGPGVPLPNPRTGSMRLLYDQRVPAFNNQTINEILANPRYYLKEIDRIEVNWTGNYRYDCTNIINATAAITGNISGQTSMNVSTLAFSSPADAGGAGASGAWTRADDITKNRTTQMVPTLESYTVNINRNGICNWDVSNVQLRFTVYLRVGICDASTIPTEQICRNYCQSLAGIQDAQCFNDYNSFCFTPTIQGNFTTAPMGQRTEEGQFCRDFYTQYIANNGNNIAIDKFLDSYCAQAFPLNMDQIKTLADVQRASEAGVTGPVGEICQCHLSDSVYSAFVARQFDLIPGYQQFSNLSSIPATGVNTRCYWPGCASSRFKRIGAEVCQVPQCINVTRFVQSEGATIEGNVNVNQSQICTSIVNNNVTADAVNNFLANNPAPGPGPNPGPNPNPNNVEEKSWISRYWWVLLGGGVFLIILIIIFVIIFGGNKKGEDKKE
jgi:hypothetical protein